MKRGYKVPKWKDWKFAKDREKDDFLSHYIHRRVSRVFSWVFVHFTLCAELIALITPALDLLTIYLIAQGNWILAGIMVYVSLMTDASDGEIARYRAKIRKRSHNKGQFGAYMDSMAGILIFPLVIFAAGYYMDNLMAGLLTMLSFLLLNASTGFAGYYFKDKDKKSKSVQEGLLGKVKNKFGMIGFVGLTGDVQKMIIMLALFFQSAFFLWVYFAAAMFIVIVKFFIYNKD